MQSDLIRTGTISGASLSACGRYRFGLWRTWGEANRDGTPASAANFIMLNPSTADAIEDDPTIRRCMGYARRWGLDGVTVTNLYPLRATNPKDLWVEDRLGPAPWNLPGFEGKLANDTAIMGHAANAFVVCAWGANAEKSRADAVRDMLDREGIKVHYLRLTKGGFPAHPLYLPADLEPQPWAI